MIAGRERWGGDGEEFPPLPAGRAKLVRALHRKKERQAEQAYLAEGERLLEELAARPEGVMLLFGTEDRMAWLAGRFPGVPLYRIPERATDLFATDSPQGVGAVVAMPASRSLEELLAPSGPVLFLDALGDPGNVGTIIRTAEWFGLRRILLGQGCVDVYNPKVVRASMGAIFNVEILEQVAIGDLAAEGRPLVALDGAGREMLGDAKLSGDAIYVIGSEAHGLSPEIASAARLIAIPGSGTVESLNAGIAAGILCYELARLNNGAAPVDHERAGAPSHIHR